MINSVPFLFNRYVSCLPCCRISVITNDEEPGEEFDNIETDLDKNDATNLTLASDTYNNCTSVSNPNYNPDGFDEPNSVLEAIGRSPSEENIFVMEDIDNAANNTDGGNLNDMEAGADAEMLSMEKSENEEKGSSEENCEGREGKEEEEEEDTNGCSSSSSSFYQTVYIHVVQTKRRIKRVPINDR